METTSANRRRLHQHAAVAADCRDRRPRSARAWGGSSPMGSEAIAWKLSVSSEEASGSAIFALLDPTVARVSAEARARSAKEQTAMQAAFQELSRKVSELLVESREREKDEKAMFAAMLARIDALSAHDADDAGPRSRPPDEFYAEFGLAEDE